MNQFIVDSEQSGQRLDIYVATKLNQLSRAFVQRLGEQGKITVNGNSAKAGYKLKTNDVVNVAYDLAELERIPTIDIPILYEDDDCVVMNKPAGILTHATGKYQPEASVATFLRSKAIGLDEERSGIVHRLDRATSGVIVGAKTSAALSYLQKQFAQRRVKKTYIAIVEGELHPHEAIVDMPIERNPKAPATFRVGANGKASVTAYRVLRATGKLGLVELIPATGRTHQLRVHLAHIGHPIVGDPLYGHGNYGDRLFLHAYQLEITLPNRERKTFEAPLPPEFEELMQ